ncbi:MAG: phospholipase D-like domain-containing protein, partial [Pseudomonadota bacterium]
GSRPMSNELEMSMIDAGVDVSYFRPLATWRVWRNDKRTHRKILVVDGEQAFTGGVGIAQEWSGDARHPGEWRDTHFCLKGPVVPMLSAAFLDNWFECGHWHFEADPPVTAELPDGVPVQLIRASSTVGWTDIATVLRTAICMAQSRIWMCTPYFVPDWQTISLLREAMERGVEIRLIVPGQHADTPYSRFAGWRRIGSLLDSGLRLSRYEPTFMHAKILLVDDCVACIGSANINHRSLSKDEECCAMVISESLVDQLRADFDHDWSQSQPYTSADWQRRSWVQRCKEQIATTMVEQL